MFYFAPNHEISDSRGNFNDLVILSSIEDRKYLEPIINKYILFDTLYAPEPEPIYIKNWIKPEDFKYYNKYSNILIIGIDDPIDDSIDTYDSQANQNLAANLKGKLMLTYGSLDDNVHPNLTLLVAKELIEHNKDFDMLVLPNRNHGYAREEYIARRTWDYFVIHLMGSDSPKEYKIKNIYK